MGSEQFQPLEMFRCMNNHDVRYILIGGLAAVLQGSPIRTGDADICPATDRANLEHLAQALSDMDAQVRSPSGEGVPFACDADFLARVDVLNLTTTFGDLDLCFVPAGTGGYVDLIRRTDTYDIEGVLTPVADLEDIVRSKTAIDREKDRLTLPALQSVLRERKRKPGASPDKRYPESP